WPGVCGGRVARCGGPSRGALGAGTSHARAAAFSWLTFAGPGAFRVRGSGLSLPSREFSENIGGCVTTDAVLRLRTSGGSVPHGSGSVLAANSGPGSWGCERIHIPCIIRVLKRWHWIQAGSPADVSAVKEDYVVRQEFHEAFWEGARPGLRRDRPGGPRRGRPRRSPQRRLDGPGRGPSPAAGPSDAGA